MSESYRETGRHSPIRFITLPCWKLALSTLCLLHLSGFWDAQPLAAPSPAGDSISVLQMGRTVQVVETERGFDTLSPEDTIRPIADPFEPVNRFFFYFNDRLYFWVLKPVASGYGTIVPQPFRVGVRNFFSNLATPIRLTNCLLQFKFKGAGIETARFFLNSSLGVAGFFDAAKREFKIDKQEEDFGQTLGFYGIGPIFYINWPIWGPSTLRDTVGSVADSFLDPWNYLVTSTTSNLAVKAYDRINNTSLTLGEYEALKRAALDPYVALRDAYEQYRWNKITGRTK